MPGAAPMTETRILSATSVSGIEFQEIVYPERLRIPPHVHPRAGFCLVLGGDYEERYASRTLQCAPRTVTFSPAGEEHVNSFAGRAHCFTIDIPQPWLSRSRELDVPFETRGGPLPLLASRLLSEHRRRDEATPLMMEGLVLEMIGEAIRDSHDAMRPRVSAAMRQARDLIEARCTEKVSLDEIARAIDRHPVYLATQFRRCYGETIGNYQRRLRIDRARHLLTSTELPLTEIAFQSGFANQSHFSRVFRRGTGMTPAAYRRGAPWLT
jgi:AraC family transcriptional regulator